MESKELNGLLIEDNPADTRIILEFLSDVRDFSVRLECRDRLSTGMKRLHEEPADIILLDLSLPDSQGLDSLLQLRTEAPDTPIVILTGLSDEQVAKKAIQAGAQDYLIKGRISSDLLAHSISYAIERKRTEKALRTSEHRYRQLFENADEAILIVDEEGRYIDANHRAERLTGYRRDELIQMHAGDLTPKEEMERGKKKYLELKTLGNMSGEYTILKKDGTVLLVESSANCFAPGQYLSILRDITERKRGEEQLRQSEERFRQLAENITEVFWMTDPEMKEMIYISPGYEKIWWRSRKNLYERPADWLDAVHPNDRERVEAALQSSESLETLDEEFRIIRPDKSIRWIRDRAFPIKDASGKVYRLTGIAEDITERKKMEEALRNAKEFSENLIETANVMILGLDTYGHINIFNQAAEKVTGYTMAELKGQNWFETLVPTERYPHVREEFTRLIAGGLPKSFENPILTKSGEERLITWQNNHVKVNGKIVATISFGNDVTASRQSEKIIHHMAFYDSLTGLPNRSLLRDRLEQAMLSASYENQSVGLLLIDLDHFKEINDTLGHHRGDLLLKQIGPRLQAVLQGSVFIARLGGDEFAVLLPTADTQRAVSVAGEIGQALESPFFIEGMPILAEASIGIALSPEHGGNPDSLIQRADIAMYVAKENRTGYALYSSKVDKHSPRRLVLLGALRNAIESDHLFLVYQPKVDLKTGRITGVEALVRWQHADYGVIPPDQFITIAEQSGLIKPLTLWVVKAAFYQCKVWHQQGKRLNMAINLSARNLEDTHLPDQISELLRTSGISPTSVEMEITESALMIDPIHAMETLQRLSDMGIQLSIDDFGTGYSSLGYLKRLPVNEIKIDKSFVMEMMKDPDDVMIVRSTIELTHNLGLKVVAEGVESKEVLDQLTTLGCDGAQGYYISRPISASELNVWFTETAPLNGWTLT
jgi:diguanylate cyclase (GGDEF)-like protein/PAS domain S-box-containing protein